MNAMIYTTNTGSTERYARLLAQKTGLPAYSLAEAKKRVFAGAEQGCPEALEHLHNAGALLGTACGHLTHLPPPDSPLWLSPEERGDGEARLLPLARDLGFPDIGAMQAVFHGLE